MAVARLNTLKVLMTVVFALALSGCQVLTSSSGSSGSSQGTGGLVSYDGVRQRSIAQDPYNDPRRRPRSLPNRPDYPFNDEIPFYPKGRANRVSSDFGWRNLWGRLDFHCGVDVPAKIGTPILAVTDGTVTLSRRAGKNGGIIMHFGGRQYTYWHIVPASWVKEGTRVRRGQKIGTLANWGSNTHIHYGVYLTQGETHPNARKDTNCVDPMDLAAAGIF